MVIPKGQPLVIMRHRASDEALDMMKRLLACLQSDIVELSWQQHDQITADTQAVTHLAFLSMGTAWQNAGVFPWLNDTYVGGIENVKVNMTLRIYGSKWHVYAGLAIMNPSARKQIGQYAKSVSDLFKLMIQQRADEFKQRVLEVHSYY
jgi:prephenate dehydrogenase (NADP+)